jgi:hypothetical protein
MFGESVVCVFSSTNQPWQNKVNCLCNEIHINQELQLHKPDSAAFRSHDSAATQRLKYIYTITEYLDKYTYTQLLCSVFLSLRQTTNLHGLKYSQQSCFIGNIPSLSHHPCCAALAGKNTLPSKEASIPKGVLYLQLRKPVKARSAATSPAKASRARLFSLDT